MQQVYIGCAYTSIHVSDRYFESLHTTNLPLSMELCYTSIAVLVVLSLLVVCCSGEFLRSSTVVLCL